MSEALLLILISKCDDEMTENKRSSPVRMERKASGKVDSNSLRRNKYDTVVDFIAFSGDDCDECSREIKDTFH
jgi:hypothetical protein